MEDMEQNDYSKLDFGNILSDGKVEFIFVGSGTNSPDIIVQDKRTGKRIVMVYKQRIQCYEGDGYFLHAYFTNPIHLDINSLMVYTLPSKEKYLFKVL